MTPALRVLVVDDHPLWRQSLAALLASQGLAADVVEAGDGAEAVDLARRLKPDVVVMDMQLPKLSGVDAAEAIKQDPGTPVLMLCSSDGRRDVLAAVRAGVSGYLVKTAGGAQIADAVRRVQAGELVFPTAVSRYLLDEVRGGAAGDPLLALTDRERSVLSLMAEGRSNQAIATSLFMSPKTVETHVSAIFGKLGLEEAPDSHRRVQAVVTFLRAAST